MSVLSTGANATALFLAEVAAERNLPTVAPHYVPCLTEILLASALRLPNSSLPAITIADRRARKRLLL